MKSLVFALLLALAPASNHHLHLDDEISDKTVAPLVAALDGARGRVVIEIDSPGGEVEAGWQLVRAIERSAAHVVCVVDGEADSMAFVVLQACDERVITERSLLMAHEAAAGVRGQPDDIQNGLNHLRRINEQLVRFCARRMGMRWQRLSAMIAHGRELWLGPEEALRLHAVDRVVVSVGQVL